MRGASITEFDAYRGMRPSNDAVMPMVITFTLSGCRRDAVAAYSFYGARGFTMCAVHTGPYPMKYGRKYGTWDG